MESSSYSLYQVVTSLSRLIFISDRPSRSEQDKFVDFILAHQNPMRGFTFHPTESEQAAGLALVTGEPALTQLLRFHAFELETLRLLALLRPDDARVRSILRLADDRLSNLCYAQVCTTGECKGATIANLRYRMAHNPDAALTRTALAALRQHRTDAGRWRGFPFLYTLLWLLELPRDVSRGELRHAAPAIERAIDAVAGEDDTVRFQREILSRTSSILERQRDAPIPLAVS